MKQQNKMYVTVDYEPLTVRSVKITKLPCPAGNRRVVIDSTFCSEPWEAARLIIDVYANFSDFKTRDSAGHSLISFDMEYVIDRFVSTDPGSERPVRVAENKERFTYDITDVGKKAGFIARTYTDVISDTGLYQVAVKITNGERVCIRKRVITLDDVFIPLEIVSDASPSPVNTEVTFIPNFAIGPVSRKEPLRVFFAVEGLRNNPGDTINHAVAYVHLYDPRKEKLTVEVGEIIVPPISGDVRLPECSGTCVDTWSVKSRYARGLFLYELDVPDTIARGDYMLAFQLYAVDYNTGQITRIGGGRTPVRIE
jgi:hypothetical protein